MTQWEKELEAHVLKFNEKYAQVLVGGKHRIMEKKDGKYVFSSQEDREKHYRSLKIQVGVTQHNLPKYKNLFSAWSHHPKSKVYRGGVVFNPALPAGDNGDGVFNLWEGLHFSVEPKENAKLLKPIEHHIENVICNGDQQQIANLYDWIAYNFQFPAAHSMRTAVLCRGLSGELLGALLRNIWGNHAWEVYSTQFLVKPEYNQAFEEKLFIFGNLSFLEIQKNLSNLRFLITAHFPLMRKGIGEIGWNRSLKVFLCTHEDGEIPRELKGRTLEFNPIEESKAYHCDIKWRIADKDIQAAFLFKMLNYRVSDRFLVSDC